MTEPRKIEAWSVDVSNNDVDSTVVVTITSPALYLDFCCHDANHLATASHFLHSPPPEGSLPLGTFCDLLSVELDSFAKEPDVVYLSVTKQGDQSMAYCLHRDDRAQLAAALLRAAPPLTGDRDEKP